MCAGLLVPDNGCDLCKGEGVIQRLRCPSREAAGAEEFLRAYIDLEAGLGWPVDGGRSRQAAVFLDMKAVADRERSLIETEKEATRKAVAGALARKGRGGKGR